MRNLLLPCHDPLVPLGEYLPQKSPMIRRTDARKSALAEQWFTSPISIDNGRDSSLSDSDPRPINTHEFKTAPRGPKNGRILGLFRTEKFGDFPISPPKQPIFFPQPLDRRWARSQNSAVSRARNGQSQFQKRDGLSQTSDCYCLPSASGEKCWNYSGGHRQCYYAIDVVWDAK